MGPRGCADEEINLFNTLGIKVKLDDKRNGGNFIGVEFLGKLSTEQECAVQKLLKPDTGVLLRQQRLEKQLWRLR